MTPSSRSSWSSTVASLRKASDGRLAGGREAPAHFERYVNLLFRLTVAHRDAAIRLSRLAASSTAWVLTGVMARWIEVRCGTVDEHGHGAVRECLEVMILLIGVLYFAGK